MIPSIQHRRSIRKFTSEPIEPEKLLSVLEAGRQAPSGNNKQPWTFIVVQSEQQRQAVMEVSHNQTWMMTAPTFIVAVADIAARVETERGLYLDETSPHWELKRAIRDTAIAIENMLLEADAQGLGTCWVGFFVRQKFARYWASRMTSSWWRSSPLATPPSSPPPGHVNPWRTLFATRDGRVYILIPQSHVGRKRHCETLRFPKGRGSLQFSGL